MRRHTILRHTLPRRTLLRGLLGGAAVGVALPALEAMLDAHGEALAAGEPLPRRLGVWFWGNGVRLARWTPTQTGRGFALTEELAPFEKVRDHLTVVSGMTMKTKSQQGHHEGTTGILSGAPLKATPSGPGNQFTSTFSAPSLDQIAAKSIGGTTRFRSLELGVSRRLNDREGDTLIHLSHNGPGSVNPAEYDPAKLFARLFGSGVPGVAAPSGSAGLAAAIANRRSVLDAVGVDLAALGKKVSAADRARLEQHAENVRALERRLMGPSAVPSGAYCKALVAPAVVEDAGPREAFEDRSRAMSELVVLALACDQTRVFSVLFSGSVNATVFWPVGATKGNHDLSHSEAGDQPTVHASVVFTMKQLAALAEMLRATPEGAGTLLDRCAIFASTDVTEGFLHQLTDYPILVLGKAGGALLGGIHQRGTAADNTSSVALSVLRAVGADVPEYGRDAGRVTEGCRSIET